MSTIMAGRASVTYTRRMWKPPSTRPWGSTVLRCAGTIRSIAASSTRPRRTRICGARCTNSGGRSSDKLRRFVSRADPLVRAGRPGPAVRTSCRLPGSRRGRGLLPRLAIAGATEYPASMNRRSFLAATAAVTAARSASAKPVRDTPLRANYFGPLFYDDKERQQLLDVVETGSPFRWYGPGSQPPKVLAFEKELAQWMHTRYALAVTEGTEALQTAIAALGIGPGDEVILPAWTWHSCFNAIVLAGALPVFAEIDESFNIDPDNIERHITKQTKLVIAVHLQGNPADLDRILPVARKHGLKVLEDCAQSVGASYKGKPLGSMGDIGIYSLQLNKTITAGEGGAVVTNDALLFERASRYHDLGNLRPLHEKVAGGAKAGAFAGSQFRM